MKLFSKDIWLSSMNSIYKFTSILIFISLPVVALAKPASELNVERLTYVGPRLIDGIGEEVFNYEIGDLYCNGDFIPSYSRQINVTISNLNGDNLSEKIAAEGMKKANGLFISSLAKYTSISHREGMSCFPRSGDTYSFDSGYGPLGDIPYVAVLSTHGNLSSVSISAIANKIHESETGELLVALNRAYGKDITIRYSVGGTAKNGVDYKRLSRKLKILAGNISAPLIIKPRKDKRSESPETISITILPSKKYNINSSNSATIDIID